MGKFMKDFYGVHLVFLPKLNQTMQNNNKVEWFDNKEFSTEEKERIFDLFHPKEIKHREDNSVEQILASINA
jgi:hypothetical protein